MQTHERTQKHNCDLCGAFFSRRLDRDRHRMRHTGEKPYKCDRCDYSCIQPGAIYRHKLKHCGGGKVNKYIGSDKSLIGKDTIKTHMAVHAETKATGRQNATNISTTTVMKSTEMNGNINDSTEDSSSDEDASTRPTSNKSGTAFSSPSETKGRIALSDQISRSKSSPDFKCKFCDKEHEDKHYLTQHDKRTQGVFVYLSRL